MKVIKRWIWYVSGIFLLVFQIPNNFKVTIEKIENMRYIITASPDRLFSSLYHLSFLIRQIPIFLQNPPHVLFPDFRLPVPPNLRRQMILYFDIWYSLAYGFGFSLMRNRCLYGVQLDAPWGHRLAHIILVKSRHHLPGGCK